MHLIFINILRRTLRTLDRRGAVSLLFATAVIPLLMMVGLAVDFGLYTQAQSQLDMAADAASIHAARVAAQLVSQNDPNFLTKGQAVGMAWFASQLGTIPQSKQIDPPIITMSYDSGSQSVTAKVSYSGVILAHFGNLFPNNWPHWPNWGIAGGATAVIAEPAYVEVLMLLDNSSSMLIASTQTGISAMEQATPCSSQGANEGQTVDYNYSWAYTPINGVYTTNPPMSAYTTSPSQYLAQYNNTIHVPYGYGTFIYPALASTNPPIAKGTVETTPEIVPPISATPTGGTAIGQCDASFDGPADECSYPGYLFNPAIFPANGVSATSGQCLNNQGGPGAKVVQPGTQISQAAYNALPATPNMPQAPCAFACHNSPTGDDYYTLAKSQHISLRYDVMQSAAKDVITKMAGSSSNSQLSVGVYQFNAPGTATAQPNGLQQVYPAPETSGDEFAEVEAGAATTTAEDLTKSVSPPITNDLPDTNFENATSLLGGFVKPAGSGNIASAPRKNLFIVTDGMDDYFVDPATQAGRTQLPINPAACDQFKTPVGQKTSTGLPGLGFTVYVLYTKYFPLANPYYRDNDMKYTEGVSPETGLTPIETAMQQCASSPANFYKASSDTDIDTAMVAMLNAALGSAGRLTN